MIYVISAKDIRLCYDVTIEDHIIYKLFLLPLYNSEKYLNGGRFKFFTQDMPEHVVTLIYENIFWTSDSLFQNWLKEKIEWIANQHVIWSMHPEPPKQIPYTGHLILNNTMQIIPSGGDVLEVKFGFEDSTIAVIFKLVFG